MILDLSSFLSGDEQVYYLEGEFDTDALPEGSDIKIVNPIKYNGEIYKVNREHLLNLTISYTYESNCDRCLQTTSERVTTVLTGKLKESTGTIDDEDELEEIISIENNRLNLTAYIWSQVVSSLPMKILCSNDCKGICPTCGIDLNTQSCDCMGNTIDPRLEKLKELFPKK